MILSKVAKLPPHMKIALFILGLLFIAFALYLRWMNKTDKRLAEFEAETFRREALEAKNMNDWALKNVYATDAEADSRGGSFIPLGLQIIFFLLGVGLMAPAVIYWFK